MLRVVAVIVLIFLVLVAIRALRLWLASLLAVSRRRRADPKEAEMVHDPVCGVWIDRRLALPTGDALVCSEQCRRVLEKDRRRVAP